MRNILELICVRCGRSYPPAPDRFTCPSCHRDVNYPGVLEVRVDPAVVREVLPRVAARPLTHGIWHWEGLLPQIHPRHQISLGEGNTPLVPADRLARAAGFRGGVLVKAEFLNPTASYKDRLAAVLVSLARAAGSEVLGVVSSGNMGAAVAAYAAAAGMKTCVIVPPPVDPAKVAQIAMYGGQVVRVRGTGGDRLGLLERAVSEFGWYNANSPLNPFGPEGAKTIAYELWLQLGRSVPDWVVLPVGFGCNLVGIWRGFRELREAGLTDRLPRLAGIQPEGSPSFVRAFKEGKDEASPDVQNTLAWGISQKVTLHSRLGLRAIRETGGTAEAVSDQAILQAERELARAEGLFVEPSSAAAVAGFCRLVSQGVFAGGETVVVVATGSGLKQMGAVSDLVPPVPEPVEPDLAKLRQSLESTFFGR
ncbi:MAG TPA: threonine synthase [Bacillota bacterium]|nr:threonine synthase [Bacillota bacterium]